jgi:hypothetical protein
MSCTKITFLTRLLLLNVILFWTGSYCFLNHISYHSVIAYNTFSHRTNISVVNLKIFIFGRASDLYFCLYNQLFALFHHVFKLLTPCNFKNNHIG